MQTKSKIIMIFILWGLFIIDDTSINAQIKDEESPISKLIQSQQIPDSLLYSMSTEALINLLIESDCPFFIHIYDDIHHGYNRVYGDYNGFRELLNRQDVAQKLIEKYKEKDLSAFERNWEPLKKAKFSHSVLFLEALLSHENILNKLTKLQLMEMLVELVRKNDLEYLHLELFWIRYNAFAIARLITAFNNNSSVSLELNQNYEIQELLKTGNIYSYNALSFVVQKAKEFLYMNYGIRPHESITKSPSNNHLSLNKIQDTYTFFTPEGMLVPNVSYYPNDILPYPEEEEYLENIIVRYNLKVKKIGPSSGRYNCGGYAFSVSEGNAPVSIGSYPTHFWTDQSYSNDGVASYIGVSENVNLPPNCRQEEKHLYLEKI